MNFDSAGHLSRATSRAKSDVANKLVCMFLHAFSRKVTEEIGLSVSDTTYVAAVAKAFGSECCYCGRILEGDRTSVEHLDGMNRFRVGLHIPGNVLLACTQCNREKRRDDMLVSLRLASSGWESFLRHTGSSCAEGCKICLYWRKIWPDDRIRETSLSRARDRILAFRAEYPSAVEWSLRTHAALQAKLDCLYRECQEFAVTQTTRSVDEFFLKVKNG